MDKKFVITIGRQYGSGGRFIGRKLAEKLNVPFYDSELLLKASEASGLSKNIMESYDEKVDGIFSGIFPSTYIPEASLGSRVFIAQFETIKKLAADHSCVIVGRCADYVLKDYENVLNVFITAPMDECVKRSVEYYGLEEKKAEDSIKKMNKKRANYYNFYTDKKWGSANSYDLCINSTIGVDETVNVIIAYLEGVLNKNE
ncbi:MAG: cytidylate kinase-like family protein [Bacilli bacterium]|nr:cytidylate kinase-like family protein [Bacilli bacterium]